ncbi:hypothetical protein [Halosolutus gelatinilyticus]|uniref:hypothetical protein n=1 Tax=Halosolutus gelatinilyticus TaxID=2931975 RepID=UPI001FF31190|nr:hypothetical protein [Halosolutus gelatinilyticus]
MAEALVFLFLLFAVGIPLVLWLAIENETSDPTVVDRSEAERIATERGGRSASRRPGGSTLDETGRDDRSERTRGDDRPPETGWDRRREWGDRSEERDRRDDEWGDRDRR